MKKVILAMGIIATVSLVSCSKNNEQIKTNQTDITSNVLPRLKLLTGNYHDKNIQNVVLQPSAWKTVVSDGLGALSGAPFGPFGAFCGGVVGSVSYVFWKVTPIKEPITTSTNPDNPYDNYGAMHNYGAAYIMDNIGNYSSGNVFNTSEAIDGLKNMQ